MTAASPHPRRRPQVAHGSNMVVPPSHTMGLRKSTTFSPRVDLSSDLCDPIENFKFLPKRSATCNKTLDDLVREGQNIEPDHRTTLRNFLNDVTNAVEGQSTGKFIDTLQEQQVLAVPRVLVDNLVIPEPMDIDKKPDPTLHDHDSDSGIGSSVGTTLRLGINTASILPPSANTVEDHHTASSSRSTLPSVSTARSAITKSFSLESSLPRQSGPQLSKGALRHIHRNILKPILDEPSLKEFHPLVNSIPRQVDDHFITNLRDLEKTFLYSAPSFSLSPDSFTKFWEFSIRCFHSTVEYLADRDQRRPSDRPYTNNYFIDLVEQIRRYAEIMARTREKEANGEALDEMDFSPDESVTIQGGLSKDGKPAELVRNKNGKSIPLAPENPRDDESMTFKRPFEDYEDDDDVLRSMARRRKSDKAGDVMHICSVCRKEFKRPCDLTKHEKTHSRPFKCTDRSCRYHEVGWPTEKERDRHINDKHSSAPRMYHCLFKPCTYASKRESNCKQHMEKTHNWTYVRSKSNGKKKATTGSVGSVQSPPTPISPFVATPNSTHLLGTPESLMAKSPWMPNDSGFVLPDPQLTDVTMGLQGRRDSTTTAGTNFTYSSGFSAEQLQMAYDAISPSANIAIDSPLFGNSDQNLSYNLSPMPMQQPTPPLSGSGDEIDLDFDAVVPSLVPAVIPATVPTANQFSANISPTTPVDLAMFGQTNMDVLATDEGFAENFDFGGQDFMLYPENTEPADTSMMTWLNLDPNYQFNGTLDMETNDLFGTRTDGKSGFGM